MMPKAKAPTGTNMYGYDNTYGGYSSSVVVPEDFVLKIPQALRPEVAAPILCAGVTTYSPMKHWGVKAGDHVGIIGFGGLGDMAAKIARAMGAHVTVFTRTKEKLDEATKTRRDRRAGERHQGGGKAEGELRLHAEHHPPRSTT